MDMGDLMVGDGKDARVAGIQDLEPEFFLGRDPALLAEESVDVDGTMPY